MEGKYTKIGTIVGVIGLLITLCQFIPKRTLQIDGEWNMTSIVNQAKLSIYIGMHIDWKIHFVRSGNKISGAGEKISVNGNELDFRDRTKIELEGTLKDNEFILRYIEKGKLRETTGVFSGVIYDDKLEGTFSQTASDSKGKIIGRKNKKLLLD